MNDLSGSEFGLHLREMKRRGRWILSVAVLAGLAMVAYRSSQPKDYGNAATVRIFLTQNQSDDGTVTEFNAKSLAERALASDALAAASKRARLDIAATEMRGRIDIELRSTPGYLGVTARGSSPDEAAELANAMALVLIDLTENDPFSVTNGLKAEVVDPADPGSSTDPGPSRAISEGLVVGLAVAIVAGESIVGLRILRGRFSPIDPSRDLQRLVGTPVLDLRDPAPSNAILPFFVEHLRARPVLTVVQAGRPSVDAARRLAKVSGDVHDRVLLVDGDAGRPTLHNAFGHSAGPGVAEVAEGRHTLRSVVRPAGGDMRAAVLTAGQARPGGLIGTELMPAMQTMLRGSGADQVVVSVTQASSIDELLLVAHAFPHAVVLALDPTEMGVTEIRRLVDQLHGVEATVVATILMPKAHSDEAAA